MVTDSVTNYFYANFFPFCCLHDKEGQTNKYKKIDHNYFITFLAFWLHVCMFVCLDTLRI